LFDVTRILAAEIPERQRRVVLALQRLLRQEWRRCAVA
jgi:hypothetical protein